MTRHPALGPEAFRLRVSVSRRRQRGVTLIELMVGLLIGLLTTIVVTQVLAFAEGQKRTTTAGSDAQVNGALALYTLQRDVQMGGYGISASQTGLGCTIKSPKFTAANGGDRLLAPVVISDGTLGAPDTIRVLASAKTSFSVPTLVTGIHPKTGAGSDAFAVNNEMGIVAGDLMIAVPPSPSATDTCTVFRANGVIGSGLVPHAVDTGAWNEADNATYPAAGYPKDSFLINLGSALVDRTYSVSAGGALQLAEFDTVSATSSTRELFPQIVNMQAFYGKDTNADGVIDSYDAVTPSDNAGWRQVMAVRIALVARSGQYERDEVTASAPVWDLGSTPTVTGSTACGSSQCLTLNLNADMANDWKHYRYKVYDTVIPLRNLLWRS
jgi:type IV pilus assembly protein PilW